MLSVLLPMFAHSRRATLSSGLRLLALLLLCCSSASKLLPPRRRRCTAYAACPCRGVGRGCCPALLLPPRRSRLCRRRRCTPTSTPTATSAWTSCERTGCCPCCACFVAERVDDERLVVQAPTATPASTSFEWLLPLLWSAFYHDDAALASVLRLARAPLCGACTALHSRSPPTPTTRPPARNPAAMTGTTAGGAPRSPSTRWRSACAGGDWE